MLSEKQLEILLKEAKELRETANFCAKEGKIEDCICYEHQILGMSNCIKLLHDAGYCIFDYLPEAIS